LALFFVAPGLLIERVLAHLTLLAPSSFPWHDVTLDPSILWWSWGYEFGLIGLAAMVAAVVAYCRERERPPAIGLSPVFGALASWLHPWQGATLILIVVSCELLDFARARKPVQARRLLLTTVATALPLVYYSLLTRMDVSWKLGEAASGGGWPLWALAICELPLALPAALAYAQRPRTFLGLTARVWPVAALVVFLVTEAQGGFALHAFLGINVPLAVLAVQGWSAGAARLHWLRLPAIAWFVVLALTIPALVEQLQWAQQSIATSAQPAPPRGHGDATFVAAGERHALDFLADLRQPGGVLTRSYLGTVVPALTGRSTYIGDSFWTPGFASRLAITDSLFEGRMPANAARRFVRSTGARFVLVDCGSRQDLDVSLASLIGSVRRFGCASVYTLKALS
jgi:hypothetical protein